MLLADAPCWGAIDHDLAPAIAGSKDSAMTRSQRGGRLGAAIRSLAAPLGLLAATPSLAIDAKQGELGIELNKLEDSPQGCRSIFVFDNRTGHELNRFRIDLILFDTAGVYSKQLLLDMAPLYADKKTVASFLLGDQGCDGIGSILVNDVPWCEDGAGASLECVKMLDVRSLTGVPLQK
jgi:hypothetical protein